MTTAIRKQVNEPPKPVVEAFRLEGYDNRSAKLTLIPLKCCRSLSFGGV